MANEKQKNYWTNLAKKKWLGIADEMDVRFAAIDDALMQASCLRAGENVLDIGCGTGATSLQAARHVGAHGRVRGVDVSPPMLEVARNLALKSGLQTLDFIEADAQTDHPGLSADVLISRFGVMFFEDPLAAFNNLRYHAAPGARLAFAVWADLDKNEHWYRPFELVKTLVGEGSARRVNAPGPLAFAEAGYVYGLLSKAGWKTVHVQEQSVDLMGESLKREAQIACILGPSGALLEEKQADETMLKMAEELFLKSLPDYAKILPDGRVSLPAAINIITAHLEPSAR